MMRNVIALILLLVPTALAWNGKAHRIIAQIAGSLMTPKTSRYIREHLMAVPQVSKRRSIEALVEASTWADKVVDNGELPWSADLHFSHTPYRACDAFNFERDCGFDGSGRCLVSGIANYTVRAADLGLSLSERADAIKFLIHFVADAHQGLHVGFAEDFGGNAISLSHPAEYNLHGSWDSYLLREYKSGLPAGADASWYGIASSLISRVETDDVKAGLRMTNSGVDDAMKFAAEMVTDTSTSVTCQYAYQDETAGWIQGGDSLSSVYVTSRSEVMLTQFMKAGVRLAQLLDSVATAYYRAERAVTPLTAGGAGAGIAEPTTRFPWDFDPEDFVYEVDEEDVEMKFKLEAPVSATAPITAAYYTLTTTTVVPETRSPEDRKRMKRQKAKAREAKKKRLVCGVDIDEVVLIKRRRRFVITSKSHVGPEDSFPTWFTSFHIEFGSGGDSSSLVEFSFDADVFNFNNRLPPPELLIAVFAKLRNVAASPDEFALPPSGSGDLAASSAMVGPVMSPAIQKWVDSLTGPDAEKPFSVPFSHIEGLLKPKLSPAELRLQYGGEIPSEDTRINDIFFSQESKIVATNLGAIILVSRFDYLMDRSIRRWVFNEMMASDPHAPVLMSYHLYIDARLLDEVPTSRILEAMAPLSRRPLNRALLQRIVKSKPPPIFEVMKLLGNWYAEPTQDCEWVPYVESIKNVIRPHWGGRQLSTQEIVLRTPEETAAFMSAAAAEARAVAVSKHS